MAVGATHPFLRSLKCGRRAQRGDGCIAAVGEEVCKVPFRFRRAKHELFVIASKANSALGLEALNDLKDSAQVWATINVVAGKIDWRRSVLAFAATRSRFGRVDFRVSQPSHECRR